MCTKTGKQLITKSTKVKALSGSMVPFGQCVGKCRLHHCFLTQTQLKNRQCILKNCKSLIKILDNPYWERKAKLNETKKEHKKEKKAVIDNASRNSQQVKKDKPTIKYKSNPYSFTSSIGDLIKSSSNDKEKDISDS